MIPLISFSRFLSFQRNVSRALFVLSVSLYLFHRWIRKCWCKRNTEVEFLYKVFITKRGGEGSSYRGRAGEVRKKEGKKVKSIHNNCFYGREIQPEVKELQCPLKKY